MGAMVYQVTSITIVYSTVYSGADQRKHQSSASLAFVWGIHRWPVNSSQKWSVTRKMFPFDDVIMMLPARFRPKPGTYFDGEFVCNSKSMESSPCRNFLLAIWSPQIFAQDTIAQLSCHAQNFVAITMLETDKLTVERWSLRNGVRAKQSFH